MRSSRLLQLMLTLQHGRSTTARALAEDAGVSVRTIYRDITALAAAGVPIWTESGPGGGIRLLDGWQSKLSGMTGVETTALMLLGVPSIAADLGLGDAIAAAENKLLRALPAPMRTDAQLWRERLHVDAPGWFTLPDVNVHLPVVSAAVFAGRVLELGYRGSTRRVDPLGLVAKASVWYLVASRAGRILSYRVDRIESATAASDLATRPAGFDLAGWWTESMASFDRALLSFPCRVRLSPSAIRALPNVIGREATPDPTDPDGDGWSTVDLVLESEEVALGQLMSLGVGVEVLFPVSLRTALRESGLDIARRHS